MDKKRDRSNIAPPDFSVAGKHVLITGGTGGIGGAFAKAFLDHGANVIVADLAAPKDGTDPRIRYEQLDVRDDAAVEALAARVEKLDVMIHCAGLRLNGKDFQNLPIEERKAKLEALPKKLPGVIRYSVSFTKDIKELLARAQ